MGEARQPLVYISGFGAFGDRSDNPSSQLVRELSKQSFVHHCESSIEVSAIGTLQYLARLHQDIAVAVSQGHEVLVVHFGVNGGAAELNLEQIAFNSAHFHT